MGEKFNFNISLSVLNHLGRNLYRNIITVLGEAISNSWDADAQNVWIQIDRERSTMCILDDGTGMSPTDFQDKFLKINVADCLLKKLDDPLWADKLSEVGRESIIISALLHDICKSNYYIVEMKNKKVYSEHGKKSDSAGRYDWESVPGYTVDDKIPYGHGEKSVMMIEEFMKLKPVERYAIRWHMGFTEAKENWNTLSLAINKYPLVLAIFEADLESTYVLEKEE